MSRRRTAVDMDSQRLILFFVFAFSVFLLLDAWQRDQQPRGRRPPPKRRTRPLPARRSHAHARREARGHRRLPYPRRSRRRREQGKTDRGRDRRGHRAYQHGGRRSAAARAEAASRHPGQEQALRPARRAPSMSYTAQAGLTGGKLPNHRTHVHGGCGRAIKLAEGQDALEVRLAGAAGRTASRVTQGLSLSPRQLSHRRELRDREQGRRAVAALRVFPARARRQAAGGRFRDAADVHRHRASTPRRRNSRRSRSRTSRRTRPPTRRTATTAGSRSSSTIS